MSVNISNKEHIIIFTCTDTVCAVEMKRYNVHYIDCQSIYIV